MITAGGVLGLPAISAPRIEITAAASSVSAKHARACSRRGKHGEMQRGDRREELPQLDHTLLGPSDFT